MFKNIKLLGIAILLLVNVSTGYAIALGDYITDDTIKFTTTVNQVMKLESTNLDYKMYVIKTANSEQHLSVNAKNQVYKIHWKMFNPDIQGMLGTNYQDAFNEGLTHRSNKFNHRFLIIENDKLKFEQFGLPEGIKEGEMVAKDLAPKDE